jgi:penicillin-binding protein 2
MGSIFKAVTASAGLHEGAVTPSTVVSCSGILHPDRPDHFRCHVFLSRGYGHGDMALREAIMKSCNIYFYTVAERLGARPAGGADLGLARDRLQAWAARFGLGSPTGLGLPGEARGRIRVGDPRNLAVGQGELLVTPVQAAQVYGLVATDGRMPPLCLIRELAPADKTRPGLALNPRHMAAIRGGFYAVVNEPGGTGFGNANLDDIRIEGKTGTAQAGRGEDHAWFVGYAPGEDPRIAFAVILEHGGHGGAAAGPLARAIVRACQAHGYLDGRRADGDAKLGGAKPQVPRPAPVPSAAPAPASGTPAGRSPAAGGGPDAPRRQPVG